MRIEVQRAGMSSGGRSSPSAIRRSEHGQCWRLVIGKIRGVLDQPDGVGEGGFEEGRR